MKHESLMRYPAPAEVVMRMFNDPEFHHRKLAQMGLAHFEVLEQHNDGKTFRIRIERQVPGRAWSAEEGGARQRQGDQR